MNTKMIFAGFASIMLLSACGQTGSEYRPIVDGPDDAYYEADLAQCQEISKRKSYLGDETQTDSLIGAGVGGAIGLLTGDLEGALAGAALGGATGAGSGAYDTMKQRETIIKNCMKNRGYSVLD